MNIQLLFDAIKQEPDQHTLTVAVLELERQGYAVKVNNKYSGSDEIIEAEERGELEHLPMRNGVVLQLERDDERQSYRMQFLDVDSICITSVDSLPVIYDPEFTSGFFKSKKSN